MAYNPLKFYGPAVVPTSDAELAIVPTSKKWLVRELEICNTSATDDNLTLAMDAESATVASNTIFQGLIVLAGETKIICLRYVLEAGQTIRGFQTTGGITLSINGLEISYQG